MTRPMPLFPASRLRQTSSVPMPHPQTKPTPVTTTRRFNGNSPVRNGTIPADYFAALACFSMYSMASFTVAIFSASSSGISMPKDSSKAITSSTVSSESAPKVVHERSGGGHFAFIHTELLDDNLLYAFFDAGHSDFSSDIGDSARWNM